MVRLTALVPASSTGKTKDLFDVLQRETGMVPNMVRTMGQSPAVLEAYLSFSGALTRASIPAQLREELALTVAQVHGCDYCLAAHTTLAGKRLRLPAATLMAARTGAPIDPPTDAALAFARQLVIQRGRVSDAEVAAVRAAGFSEAQVTEIIAQVGLSVFTNYFNLVANTALDFPAAPTLPTQP